MEDEAPKTSARPDDLPPENIEARKKQARLNAMILALVLLLSTILPHPYRSFAPFLFAIPLIIMMVSRIRRAKAGHSQSATQPDFRPSPGEVPPAEPYSCTPKDPKDPRRYKPIG